MGRTEQPLLAVTGLSISYGQIRAVEGLDLTVNPGEIVGLIGANGAGKSTVLKGILGIQRAGAGSILFRGREISAEPTDRIVASGIAIVPEGRGIIAQMTVRENLELGAYHRHDELAANLSRVLEWFPILEERKDQLAGQLSGGQQQMLALGRAMMARPDLIMMDEPSLGLAPIIVSQLFEIIVRLNAEGQTILLAEQNALKTLKVAHRGYVFERGRVALSGTGRELAQNEQVRRAYLGGA